MTQQRLKPTYYANTHTHISHVLIIEFWENQADFTAADKVASEIIWISAGLKYAILLNVNVMELYWIFSFAGCSSFDCWWFWNHSWLQQAAIDAWMDS